MKYWQFYGIQSNIMVVACLAATSNISKGIFMFLAALYLLMMILSVRE